MNPLNDRSNLKLIATLTWTLLQAGAASAALADAPPLPTAPEQTTVVRFADLNLSSPEGARALYGRIRSAAQTLCGEQFSLWDGNRLREWRQCYQTAIERAVRQIDRPALTAVHRELARGADWSKEISPHPLSAEVHAELPGQTPPAR